MRQGADSAYRPEIPDPEQAIGNKQKPPAPLAGGVSVGATPGEQADGLRSYMAKQGAGGLAMAQEPAAADSRDTRASLPSASAVPAASSNGCGDGFIVGKVTGACERKQTSAPPVPVSSDESIHASRTVVGIDGDHGDRQQVHEATPEQIFERKVMEVRQEAFIKALNAPIAVVLTAPSASSGAAPMSAAAVQIQALEQQRQTLEAERLRAEQNARDAQQQLKQIQETGPTAFLRHPIIREFWVGGSGALESVKG